MSFDKQVSETCKACYFHIRALRIRASLTEASKTIAAAIVGSRLDFCNSLLTGTSVSNLARLQRVQNTLARVVAQKPRFCHITPVLFDLNWRFRFATELAIKSLRLLTGCYNFSSHSILLLSSRDMYTARALRSSSSLSICVPTRKTTMTASKIILICCFGYLECIAKSSVVRLNSSCFRRALKHHLFLLAYPDSSAKSGMIKPAQCISLRDTVPTTAIAQPGYTMPPI